jgi:SOS-response transcriptional repressor LexA
MDGRKFFQVLLDSKSLNPHALAQKLKKPSLQSSLQRYLEGKTSEPRRSTFEPIAQFLGVSVDGFFSPGIADQELARLGLTPVGYKNGTSARTTHATNIELSTVGTVPIVSWIQAGEWCGITNNFELGDADEWLPCPIRHGPRTYALIVRGISMFDPTGAYSFKDGDTIFVDPDGNVGHRSLVVVRLDDEHEATFKQLIIEGDQRMIQALNPSWPNRIIAVKENCSICGVVIGKVESFI